MRSGVGAVKGFIFSFPQHGELRHIHKQNPDAVIYSLV